MMAGNGPAPKMPEERRNTRAPQRGEWKDLFPLEKPVLPELPDGDWPEVTVAVWAAWRSDPVTGEYSPADIAYALDTIRIHAAMTPSNASEVRLRADALGLTPKGKRDLRWRIAGDEPEQQRAPAPAKNRTEQRARLSVAS